MMELCQFFLFDPFSESVKDITKEKQDNKCDMSKKRVHLQVHHRVPENALKEIGIRGNNNEDNAVALSEESHKYADYMAIKKRLFWVDGEFVPLEEVPVNMYHHEKRTKKKSK
jgi:hypothetical protein